VTACLRVSGRKDGVSSETVALALHRQRAAQLTLGNASLQCSFGQLVCSCAVTCLLVGPHLYPRCFVCQNMVKIGRTMHADVNEKADTSAYLQHLAVACMHVHIRPAKQALTLHGCNSCCKNQHYHKTFSRHMPAPIQAFYHMIGNDCFSTHDTTQAPNIHTEASSCRTGIVSIVVVVSKDTIIGGAGRQVGQDQGVHPSHRLADRRRHAAHQTHCNHAPGRRDTDGVAPATCPLRASAHICGLCVECCPACLQDTIKLFCSQEARQSHSVGKPISQPAPGAHTRPKQGGRTCVPVCLSAAAC
jgi:hypothetical protein